MKVQCLTASRRTAYLVRSCVPYDARTGVRGRGTKWGKDAFPDQPVIHFAATYNPSMEWVVQQLREAMPFGQQPRYMFRDNDGIYGHGVHAFLNGCGIEEVRTAYRSPWQNPYVER